MQQLLCISVVLPCALGLRTSLLDIGDQCNRSTGDTPACPVWCILVSFSSNQSSSGAMVDMKPISLTVEDDKNGFVVGASSWGDDCAAVQRRCARPGACLHGYALPGRSAALHHMT
jgi:hypothetical protein